MLSCFPIFANRLCTENKKMGYTNLIPLTSTSVNSSWPSDAIWWRQHIVLKPYIFHYEIIPPNLRFCNFSKVNIIINQNPLQKLRNFTFWLFLGGGGGDFFTGCGEKTAITQLILRLAVKIPAFFQFFGLKRVKCLTFYIQHLIINIKS